MEITQCFFSTFGWNYILQMDLERKTYGKKLVTQPEPLCNVFIVEVDNPFYGGSEQNRTGYMLYQPISLIKIKVIY